MHRFPSHGGAGKESEKLRNSCWTWAMRRNLQQQLSEGYTLTACSEMLGVTLPTLRAEVRRGCTADETKGRRYTKYKASRALLEEALSDVDKDTLAEALEEMRKEVSDVCGDSN